MTARWIVTALGQDRPGIVAGVTKALYQLGCNLEDSAMTRLEGEFAIMLIFSGPSSVTAERIAKAFEPLKRQLVVHVKRLNPAETTAPASRGTPYMISMYGGDHPGIVFRVAEALAKEHVNITDVHTHRSQPQKGKPSSSLYLMLLEIEVPARLSAASLERLLAQLGKRLGVQVSLRPSETAVL